MDKKSILIVEDDFSFALELEMSLTQDTSYDVYNVSNAQDAQALIKEQKFDAVLLDLYLKGALSGVQLGSILKNKDVPIIVITAHADEELYKLTKSFDPVAFLVKPFDRLTLISTLDSAIKEKVDEKKEGDNKIRDEILVRANSQLHKIKYNDITHVNSDGNYCIIHTANLRYAIKKSLKRLMEELPAHQFIRIHKSYVVQVDLIANVDLANKTLTIGETEIPFGKKFKKELIERFY